MKLYLTEIVKKAVHTVAGEQELPPLLIEKPRIPEHGDAATSIALQLAKLLKKPPRKIAEDIIAAMDIDPSRISSVEIAGPGFINFRYADEGLRELLSKIEAAGDR